MSKDIDHPIEPSRAPVVPRVRLVAEGATLPLEHHVRAIHASGLFKRINLIGPTGSGKTTALRHLAAALPPTIAVRLEDDWICVGERLSVFTSHRPTRSPDCIALEIAPWTQDDLIEYCTTVHRDRCASILRRALRSQQSCAFMGGLPELWRAALDAMAEDENLEDVNAALSRALETAIPDPKHCALAGEISLQAIQATQGMTFESGARNRLPAAARRALLHRPFRMLLAADRVAGRLIQRNGSQMLKNHFPRDLTEQIARRVRGSPSAIDHLRGMADGKNKRRQPMSTSLLDLVGNDWRPSGRRPINLARAWLSRVSWPDARLCKAVVRSADLREADLSGADCTEIAAESARLFGADLHGAWLTLAHLDNADLSYCDLQSIEAVNCDLRRAKLINARLDNANLERAMLHAADLTEASLRGVNLSRATLSSARIDGTNFSHAIFTAATIQRMSLRIAEFNGAVFRDAHFNECDLSGMQLPNADFRNAQMGKADLTATVMPNSDWREADLRGCGLAEVEWEGADLRNADFSNASFHMGSTRSGLVGSVIASEGTRTGFYTDDYFDQDYKPPEQIRKANLCGCDLRGAKVLKTDWYLVDLRRANYTADQAEHFSRCGAILHDRPST